MLRFHVVIPARYASTRLPGKPLAQIDGRPMIWYVWEKARKSRLASRVVVATDDDRIAAAVKKAITDAENDGAQRSLFIRHGG